MDEVILPMIRQEAYEQGYRIELFEKGVETDGQQFDLATGGD